MLVEGVRFPCHKILYTKLIPKYKLVDKPLRVYVTLAFQIFLIISVSTIENRVLISVSTIDNRVLISLSTIENRVLISVSTIENRVIISVSTIGNRVLISVSTIKNRVLISVSTFDNRISQESYSLCPWSTTGSHNASNTPLEWHTLRSALRDRDTSSVWLPNVLPTVGGPGAR